MFVEQMPVENGESGNLLSRGDPRYFRWTPRRHWRRFHTLLKPAHALNARRHSLHSPPALEETLVSRSSESLTTSSAFSTAEKAPKQPACPSRPLYSLLVLYTRHSPVQKRGEPSPCLSLVVRPPARQPVHNPASHSPPTPPFLALPPPLPPFHPLPFRKPPIRPLPPSLPPPHPHSHTPKPAHCPA